jgi:hypothetical protein
MRYCPNTNRESFSAPRSVTVKGIKPEIDDSPPKPQPCLALSLNLFGTLSQTDVSSRLRNCQIDSHRSFCPCGTAALQGSEARYSGRVRDDREADAFAHILSEQEIGILSLADFHV